MRTTLRLVAVLLAPFVLAGCFGGASGGPQNNVTGVSITPQSLTLDVGESYALQVEVLGSQNVSQSVAWRSSDPAIATVNENGVVTAVASGGPVTITATSRADATKSATATVTVAMSSAACAAYEPEELGGRIDSARTLTKVNPAGCVDYVVIRDLEAYAALTVDAGVKLAFAERTALVVRPTGSLNAVGTAAAPIVFTGTKQEQGHWETISIRSNDPRNELTHAVVEYAGAASSYGNSGSIPAGVIVAQDAQLAVERTTFRHNAGNGLYLHGDAVLSGFADNAFAGNGGAPLRLLSDQLGYLDGASNYSGSGMTANGQAYIDVAASTTRRAQTWPKTDLPYRFSGLHYVNTDNAAAQVTLAAGATIEFAHQAGLRINNGSFRAVGSPSERITLTGAVRTQTGYWEALVFNSNDPGNELAYVDVAFGGAGASYGFSANDKANVIVAEAAQVSISDSTFTDSGEFGLFLRPNARLPRFENNAFAGNSGAPVRLLSNQLGLLDAGTTYSGGGRPNNEGHEYVDVQASTITGASPTWRSLDVPYRFHGHHYVDGTNTTVTVVPGARFEFATNAGIRVNQGALNAVGTAGQRITFTGAVETPGFWEALVFVSNNPNNRLHHVDIAHGGAGSSWGFSQTTKANVVLLGSARLDIANATVRESGQYCHVTSNDATLTIGSGMVYSGCQQE